MSDNTATGEKGERKVLGWFGNQLAGVIVGYILGGILSSVLSIFVTLLLLLKAGLLRLSQWPGTAFIVLAILISIIAVLVFGLAVVYVFWWLMYLLLVGVSRLFKMEPPKRSRLLMPLDAVAGLILRGVDRVMEWRMEGDSRRTEQSPRNQGNRNQS